MAVVNMSSIPEKGNKKIVVCKSCKKPEYWNDMRWWDGVCMCRDCYRNLWEKRNHGAPYRWDDLDGKRPTQAEYDAQKAQED
mgnify:CR=1 FL=1